MQPRFSIQIVAVSSLCLTVVAAWHCSLENSIRLAAIDCANWNSNEYFEAATAAGVTDCLRSGADLEARAEDGSTPLHVAAVHTANPAVITALLDAGADLEARSEGGITPLHLAAMSNANPAVITALVNVGADLKARSEGGLTPLHLAAARTANPAVITALVDVGADLKARGWEWHHASAFGGHVER